MNTQNIDVNMNDLEHFICSLGETVFLEMEEVEDVRYARESGDMFILKTNGARYKVSVDLDNTQTNVSDTI